MKIKELQQHLRKNRISCAIFFNKGIQSIDPNLYYFSRNMHPSCMIVPAKSKPVMLVSSMEAESARIASRGIKVVVAGKRYFQLLRKYARGSSIGIDYGSVTLLLSTKLKKDLKGKRFKDISLACLQLRAVKTKEEIMMIRQGCRISDQILKGCFRNFKRFRTEKDVVIYLAAEASRRGCELSFNPIVASGSSSSQPHHTPGTGRLKKGFCVIDFGVKYKGYCTDTTRTIYLGKPSKEEARIYNLLLNAQKKTISCVKPGAKCDELWMLCADSLGKYSKNMIHGLGHGVGLDIHELPSLRLTSQEALKEGNVLTVEPGVYFKGRFGVRIEDTVLVGKKPEILTKIPKDLLRIKKK